MGSPWDHHGIAVRPPRVTPRYVSQVVNTAWAMLAILAGTEGVSAAEVPLNYLLTTSIIPSITPSLLTYLLTHSLTHPPTHTLSLTHSPTHTLSLTHPLACPHRRV